MAKGRAAEAGIEVLLRENDVYLIVLLVGSIVLVEHDAGFHRHTFGRQLRQALEYIVWQSGANELSELALRQETAAKERNIPEIEKGAENLLLKYEQTVKLLQDILHLDVSEPVPEEAKETISVDDLRKKLGEARACIENFEAESALEILKPLASHSFADSAVGEALRKTIDALEDFDTLTAEEGINAIMERVEK